MVLVPWNYHDDMAPRIGRPPKYNWDELTDGSIWKAIQDEDFDATPKSFRTLLRYQARKRNIPVKIHVRGKVVWFQFSKADLGWITKSGVHFQISSTCTRSPVWDVFETGKLSASESFASPRCINKYRLISAPPMESTNVS